MNEGPSIGLSESLRRAGFKLGRLQTGTPARLAANSIDFEKMAKFEGDIDPLPFSYINTAVDNGVSVSSRIVAIETKRLSSIIRFCVI